MTRVLLLGGLQPLQGRQTVQPGHLQIQQQDVRLVLLQDSSTCRAVLCLRHHLEVLLQREQLAEAIPENGMVVRHDDADLGLCVTVRGGDSVHAAVVFSGIHLCYSLNFRVLLVLSQSNVNDSVRIFAIPVESRLACLSGARVTGSSVYYDLCICRALVR